MSAWQVILELGLIGLLAATLFHALRLERALGVVRRDRAELETMLRGFNDSTRHAENAIDRLRGAAEGAGKHVARQIELASAIKEDLTALVDRGERLADRMDTLVRTNREPEFPARRIAARDAGMADTGPVRVRSQAERDLLKALRVTR